MTKRLGITVLFLIVTAVPVLAEITPSRVLLSSTPTARQAEMDLHADNMLQLSNEEAALQTETSNELLTCKVNDPACAQAFVREHKQKMVQLKIKINNENLRHNNAMRRISLQESRASR